MASNPESILPSIFEKHESDLLKDWIEEQARFSGQGRRTGALRSQSIELLRSMREATGKGSLSDIRTPDWSATKDLLASLCRDLAQAGSSPSETARFVLSLKRPLFNQLRSALKDDQARLADEIWIVTSLLDDLALYTTEVFQKTREEVIVRQQQDMLELSTPVVKLWDGILAVPLIGTLDSNRTQVVMESLLQAIMDTGSEIAIIDITGVPTVDTLVAQHLMKTIAATRLMGAVCILSGIRPQIAQTIVHLGVELGDVVTKATLADAFAVALRLTGATVTRLNAAK